MAQSFAQFERKIAAVQDELSGAAGKARLARVGKLAQGDVDEAVRGTLGDDSMSGWKRGAPIPIRGASRLVGESEVFVSAGKASGPMRVLEKGRNQGNAGGMAGPGVSADGTTRRNKNGTVRKARARRARRWNGTTAGKGTWSKADALIAARTPARVHAEVRKALSKHLGRG
jgi:hypothetical protein